MADAATAGRAGDSRRIPRSRASASFIGVDGANSTALNRGRMLINLKPHDDRDPQAEIMQRLQRTCQRGRRHALSPAGAGPHHRCRNRPDAISARASKAPTPTSSTPGPTSWSSDLQKRSAGSQRARRIRRHRGSAALREHRSRLRRATRPSALPVSTKRCTARSASASSRRSSPRRTSIASSSKRSRASSPSPSDLNFVNMQTGSGKPTPLTAIASDSRSRRRRCRSIASGNSRLRRWASTPPPGVALGRAVR